MNILFISSALRYYDSSASIRNRNFVKELGKYGNVSSIEIVHQEATPLCDLQINKEILIRVKGYRSHLNGDMTRKNKKKDIISKVKELAKHFFRDILFLLNLKNDLRSAIQGFQNQFDLVITSSDPVGVHWQYIRIEKSDLQQVKYASYWQYWGDPLYGCVSTNSSVWNKYLERYILRNCDRAFWVSKPTLELKQTQHIKIAEKFEYLPRIIEKESIIPIGDAPSDGQLKAIYAGDYFKKFRKIHPLVGTFSTNREWNLTVIGNGDRPEQFASNVKFMKRIPQKEAEEYLDKAQLVFIILNKTGGQIPGKIYDLAVGEKTCVILYDSEDQLEIIPFRKRFLFCKNEEKEIVSFLGMLPSFSVEHTFSEYNLGSTLLKGYLKIINNSHA